jgi:hypothetical protein
MKSVGWSACNRRQEADVPRAKDLLQRGIQHLHSHSKKRLNGEPVPTHLLLPNHSFCDGLVDCGFDPSGGVWLVGR